MLRKLFFLTLFTFLSVGALAQTSPKALGRVSAEQLTEAGVTFDPAQSRGVFIGVNEYTAPGGVRPANLKSCVNDAIDLAATFTELGLIQPRGVTLILSGEPTKPGSAQSLHALRTAGATIAPDAKRDTIDFNITTAAASACRAGTTTANSFGDSDSRLGDYAWYSSNSGSKTHPVGSKRANPWGLYDMHGNVWEWCADWYADEYPGGSVTDPTGPNTGTNRVYRGGSWVLHPWGLRSADRDRDAPDHRYNDLGFRVSAPQGNEF